MAKSWKWIDTYERMRKKGYSVQEAKDLANNTTKAKTKRKVGLFGGW